MRVWVRIEFQGRLGGFLAVCPVWGAVNVGFPTNYGLPWRGWWAGDVSLPLAFGGNLTSRHSTPRRLYRRFCRFVCDVRFKRAVLRGFDYQGIELRIGFLASPDRHLRPVTRHPD